MMAAPQAPETVWSLYDWQAEAFEATEAFVCCVTPLGEGKTWFGARWFLANGLENPESIHLGIAAGYLALQDTMLPAFKGACEDAGIDYTHRIQDRTVWVHADRDIEFRFRTVEDVRSIDKLRGPEYGKCWMDEARNCSLYAFTVAQSRLRCPRTKHHQMLLTTTPKGFDWLRDEFVDKASTDKRLIHVRQRGNYRLPAGYDDRMMGQMSAAMAAQEISAEFVLMGSGRCYRDFDRAIHHRAGVYDRTKPLILMVDYGAESTAVVGQWIGDVLQILAEFQCAGLDNLARQAASEYRSHTAGVLVYDDAAGGIQRSGATGKTHRDILLENLQGWGGKVQTMRGKTNPSISERIETVNRALRDGKGNVRIYVDPICKRVTRDAEQVAWSKDGRSQDKGSDGSLTHFMDPVGYCAWETMRPSMFVSEPAYGMGSRTRDRNIRGGAR